MPISLHTPTTADLDDVVHALARWRRDDAPMQLHPGDVGYFWQFGPEKTAASLRTWVRDGEILAVGMLDGPDVLRLAVAPEAHWDDELAAQMADDMSRADGGIFLEDSANAEVLWGGRLTEVLRAAGWQPDEPWIPMVRNLSEPIPQIDLEVKVVGPNNLADRIGVHKAAFPGSKFSEERWQAMAEGTPYANARCLVAYNADGEAVAAATVWSAGQGKPGLLEPVGVHQAHQGKGHGKAIAIAGAHALREMGASAATVCAEGSNQAALATYKSAGYVPGPEVTDLSRP
ncbi:GNAT family N-acetyltransferase [Glycomyces sp. NPDC046736]|uniref:GNAT family N-acetyltransferase n=1 Tax=Glycomyces sp. NPDC046736 TaxID=3155615 RepID=UPI0033E5EB6A